jgi:tetratricopeptide (TPR) repeat protein
VPAKAHLARGSIGRFALAREIGRGGMGVVYEAIHPDSKRRLALKILRAFDSPEPLVRFKREFRIVKSLAHPNVVALDELFSEDEDWYFTMELVTGTDFLSFVRGSLGAQGGYSEPRLRDTLTQLVSALDVMREAGVIHRDLKPQNVLVTAEGRVVVLDFGVAAVLRSSFNAAASNESVVGTPAYMAPELALGEGSSPASDMYSVGVMLFEALTGTRPIEGPVTEVMVKKVSPLDGAAIDRLNGAPHDLRSLALDLLDLSPGARPTAVQMLARLGATSGPPTGDWSKSTNRRVFVGREAELAALKEAFAEARGGGTAAVVVRGESGIGKTALVRQSLGSLEESVIDAVILEGRCRENEWIPFKAIDGVMDALARLLEANPRDAQALLPAHADRLSQVFPTFRPIVTTRARAGRGVSADPIEQRSQLVASIREMFVRLGERYAVVIVIDDVQWADADSLAVLNELTRPPDAPSLTLLVTLRSDGAKEPPTEAAFARARIVDLERLSTSDSVALARVMRGASARSDSETPFDAELIAREAQGHPMFIEELVRYSSVAKPESRVVRLDDALGERLSALDDPTATVLRIIALAGRPATLPFVKQAASLGFDELTRIVATLRGMHAIRVSGVRGDLFEPYHDRVREVVLKAIGATERRDLHGRIAAALEAAKEPDPVALTLHWRGAGDEERARTYALRAAAAASEALAFDRAAELYESVLASGGLSPADEMAIAEKLGDALVNAGRGVRAAAAYRRAARGAPVARALDLERRAADELLRAGHFDEGVAAIRAVLASIGMSFPEKPLTALLWFLFGRMLLLLRGLRFKRRDATQIAATDLMRVDVCRSVSFGLGIVDTVRGSAFQVRALLLALRAGEIRRVALALASESAYAARRGGPGWATSRKLAARAFALAEETGDPHALGWAYGTQATSCYLNGRYSESLELFTRAIEIFRTECTGLAWEIDSGQFFSMNCLVFLGQLRRLAEELPRVLRDAFERGDRYSTVNLRVGLANIHWLALDQPQEAERQVREAMAEWSKQGFQLEHFYELVTRTNIDLYAGRPREAYARTVARWDALRRSLLPFTIQGVRILTLSSRARSALASVEDGDDPSLLRVAARDARSLEREAMPSTIPLAKLIRAGIAVRGQDTTGAIALLRSAIAGFDEAEAALPAAVARHRLGVLVGGDEGRDLVRACAEWMASERVRNPPRIIAMVAPGFEGPRRGS